MDALVPDSAQAEHGSLLLRQLEKMRLAEELTDVVLVAEGVPFPCHRVVLSAFSPYFQVKWPCICQMRQEILQPVSATELLMIRVTVRVTVDDSPRLSCVQAMFTCGLKETRGAEVPLRDTPAQSLELLIDYMYRGQLPLSNDNIQAVAAAAFLLHVDRAFRWPNKAAHCFNKQTSLSMKYTMQTRAVHAI